MLCKDEQGLYNYYYHQRKNHFQSPTGVIYILIIKINVNFKESRREGLFRKGEGLYIRGRGEEQTLKRIEVDKKRNTLQHTAKEEIKNI